MDKYHIPQHLDLPFKIILWTADEVMVFGLPFFVLFLVFNMPIVGVVIGVTLVTILKRLKGEEGHYYIAHMAYWHLPPLVRYKATPHSYVRNLLG